MVVHVVVFHDGAYLCTKAVPTLTSLLGHRAVYHPHYGVCTNHSAVFSHMPPDVCNYLLPRGHFKSRKWRPYKVRGCFLSPFVHRRREPAYPANQGHSKAETQHSRAVRTLRANLPTLPHPILSVHT